MFAIFKNLDHLGGLKFVYTNIVFTFFGIQGLKLRPIPSLDKNLATSSDKRGKPTGHKDARS